MNNQEKIQRLEEFKSKLYEWAAEEDEDKLGKLRSYLNQSIKWVEREILEAGCFKVVTISPPPIVFRDRQF